MVVDRACTILGEMAVWLGNNDWNLEAEVRRLENAMRSKSWTIEVRGALGAESLLWSIREAGGDPRIES